MPSSTTDRHLPLAPSAVGSRQVGIVIDWVRVAIAGVILHGAFDPDSATAPMAIGAWSFLAYSTLVLFLDLVAARAAARQLLTWLDASWMLMLFALSGAHPGFLAYVFVPMVFAGVTMALEESIKLSIFCALVSFSILALHIDDQSWLPALVVPFSLFAAGPLVSVLGRRDTAAGRAQASASALVERLDPNSGVEALSALLLDRAAEILGADQSLAAIRDADGRARVFLGEPGRPPREFPSAAASIGPSLFAIDRPCLVAPGPGRVHAWLRGALPARAREAGAERVAAAGAELAELIERPYLAIGAAGESEEGAVRLVFARGRRRYLAADLAFLEHLVGLAHPVFRNACLIERLSAKVAEMERTRIGRDLHDSAIQPYIGLKFAIEALARKVAPDDPVAADIGRLLAMMQEELGSIRNVIRGLRDKESEDKSLGMTMRGQIKRLSELYDLRVDLEVDESISIDGALAREVEHIVSEALSNIRRHTRSRRVQLSVTRDGASLVLAVHNEAVGGDAASADFEPKSLSSRATMLGGYTSIRADGGGTTVTICLPMH